MLSNNWVFSPVGRELFFKMGLALLQNVADLLLVRVIVFGIFQGPHLVKSPLLPDGALTQEAHGIEFY